MESKVRDNFIQTRGENNQKDVLLRLDKNKLFI